MAMNDEETVALIAGGHTFGKTHGAGDAKSYVGAGAGRRGDRGAGPRLEEQARYGQRRRRDHQRPGGHLDRRRRRKWSNNFFDNLFGYEWELTKSPAGAYQWMPKDGAGADDPGPVRQVEEAARRPC